MLNITTTDLAIYMRECGRIGRTPTLIDWISEETEGLPEKLAKEYAKQCEAVWAQV